MFNSLREASKSRREVKWSEGPWASICWMLFGMLYVSATTAQLIHLFSVGRTGTAWFIIVFSVAFIIGLSLITWSSWFLAYLGGKIKAAEDLHGSVVQVTIDATDLSEEEWAATVARMEETFGVKS